MRTHRFQSTRGTTHFADSPHGSFNLPQLILENCNQSLIERETSGRSCRLGPMCFVSHCRTRKIVGRNTYYCCYRASRTFNSLRRPSFSRAGGIGGTLRVGTAGNDVPRVGDEVWSGERRRGSLWRLLLRGRQPSAGLPSNLFVAAAAVSGMEHASGDGGDSKGGSSRFSPWTWSIRPPPC